MLFWIAVAFLAAAVTWAVARPLLGPRREMKDAFAADIAVYKDQLAEIDADRERGALPAGDADVARAEVARRLFAQAERDGARTDAVGGETEVAAAERWTKLVYATTAFALPVVSLAVYLALGAPGLPGQPLADRLASGGQAVNPNDLVAKVEARLREHPEDGRGWSVIAPVYLSMGRFDEAASAYQAAMRILGEKPDYLMGFANARLRANNGVIGDDVKAALDRVLVLDPQRKEPRVWLALAKEQDGKREEAESDYRKLLAEGPADADWKSFVEERLANLQGRAAQAAPAAESGGAAAEAKTIDPAAVAAMPAAERQQMIDQMVGRLADRLKTNGKDSAGWLQLLRAYQVLGRMDEAAKALADARAGLKDDPAGLRSVNDLAQQLGIANDSK